MKIFAVTKIEGVGFDETASDREPVFVFRAFVFRGHAFVRRLLKMPELDFFIRVSENGKELSIRRKHVGGKISKTKLLNLNSIRNY